MRFLLITLLILLVSSCASHHMMRGNVAMKIDKKTAHICLGDNEVKAGDKINFYNSECADYDNSKKGLEGLCKLILLGTGEVKKILSSHYSEVKTDGSFNFNEGTMIEKVK